MLKTLNELKYLLLIEEREYAGIKHFNDPKAFMEYSTYMDDFYKNINDYKPNRKSKILIVLGDMIADIVTNKKFQAKIKKLFIRCRKLNISLVFTTQSYFFCSKNKLD